MNEKLCSDIRPNSLITYFTNKTINYDKILKLAIFGVNVKTNVSGNHTNTCGVLTQLIVELSKKYGFR